MNAVLDVLGGVFVLAGAVLGLIGAIAMTRFPEIYSRVHTATKPQTLGLFCVLLGLALTLRTWGAVSVLLIVGVAQATTAPIAAHMLTRAAYRTMVVRPEQLYRDELAPRLREDAKLDPGDLPPGGSGDNGPPETPSTR